MESNDQVNECIQCNREFVGEPFKITNYDDALCSSDCVESYEDRQAERAYESFLDDYYGGSSAVTIDEMHMSAWKEKQELRKG